MLAHDVHAARTSSNKACAQRGHGTSLREPLTTGLRFDPASRVELHPSRPLNVRRFRSGTGRRNVRAALSPALILSLLCACSPARAPRVDDDASPDGIPCTNDLDCPNTLCDKGNDDDIIAADDPEGICAPSECDEEQPCEPGLVCFEMKDCVRLCEPPARRGESCFTFTDVARCNPTVLPCAEGLACEVLSHSFGQDGECVAPDERTFGELCVTRACDDGLACDAITSRCLLDVGEPCSSNSECASGACREQEGCVAL
jgi:hypothetical protein